MHVKNKVILNFVNINKETNKHFVKCDFVRVFLTLVKDTNKLKYFIQNGNI